MPASTIAVSSLQDRHREGKTGDQFRKLVGPILHVVLAVSLGSWWLKRRGRHLTVYLALSNVAASAAPLRKHYERTRQGTMAKPTVGVVMGSKSDWETMQHCVSTLEALGIEVEARVMSAHRTPDVAIEFSKTAEERGLEIIIAAAGGAAHLAGVMAAKTTIPVLGVPVKGWSLDGLDSLLSTVQMPSGIPVGTLAIGKAGAVNAALLAGQILGLKYPEISAAVKADRVARRDLVLSDSDPRV